MKSEGHNATPMSERGSRTAITVDSPAIQSISARAFGIIDRESQRVQLWQQQIEQEHHRLKRRTQKATARA